VHRFVAFFIALFVAFLGARATTAYAADVVIVASPANDPIAARVEDELEALGFQVIETIVEPDATIETILTGREYAKAVVHVKPPNADVWIVDPKPVLRESIAPTKKSKSDQVALRAVEVVRGSLLKMPEQPKPPPPPPPPKEEPKPPPPPPPPPRLKSRSFELAFGGALALSPGVAGQLGAHLFGPIDVDAVGAYVPLRRSVTESEGTARLGWNIVAARLRARLDLGKTALSFGLGGGLSMGFATATPAAPFESSSVTLLSPAAVGSLTLKTPIAGPFDLWIDADAVLTRPMVLQVLDREVARVSVTTLIVGGVGLSWR
jgi:hypothetical protein